VYFPIVWTIAGLTSISTSSVAGRRFYYCSRTIHCLHLKCLDLWSGPSASSGLKIPNICPNKTRKISNAVRKKFIAQNIRPNTSYCRPIPCTGNRGKLHQSIYIYISLMKKYPSKTPVNLLAWKCSKFTQVFSHK